MHTVLLMSIYSKLSTSSCSISWNTASQFSTVSRAGDGTVTSKAILYHTTGTLNPAICDVLISRTSACSILRIRHGIYCGTYSIELARKWQSILRGFAISTVRRLNLQYVESYSDIDSLLWYHRMAQHIANRCCL